MKRLVIVLWLLSGVWAAPVVASDVLRCGSRLVQTGATPAEVQALCGEPAFRDDWGVAPTGGFGPTRSVEQWTYDFGPSQLLQVLLFRDRQLQSITADGYGLSRRPGGGCRHTDIVPGLSKYRLLARCGEPTSAEAFHVLAPPRHPRHGPFDRYGYPPQVIEVYRENWVYNFGPGTLQRLLTLENGRVVTVDNGKRGF